MLGSFYLYFDLPQTAEVRRWVVSRARKRYHLVDCNGQLLPS